MHIKNIQISGFRSYRDQIFPEDLSPGNNVIVGRNGSGKSNFFAAIQFVLSEKYSTLRANERKELFHQGAGRAALSAFVEIVFDNSDGRLVIPGRAEEAEVRIRRTVGLKQDEFRVNDRKFSASEVRQLLESAGFSGSNPYYIVEQGKIVNLASMSETERFQLIKDVAGTNIYDSRRNESTEILVETEARRVKIDEAIGQLDTRLHELEAETAELKAFQEQDKKRKSLEYCIYNAEIQQAKEELTKLDSAWETRLKVSNTSRDDEIATERVIHELDAKVQSCSQHIIQLEQERQNIERERQINVSKRALLNLKARDAEGANGQNQEELTALHTEETELNKALKTASADLNSKKSSL
jgi:structural maintenance of chromosome 3 (chondroitin sulfate proteoglycan 6)